MNEEPRNEMEIEAPAVPVVGEEAAPEVDLDPVEAADDPADDGDDEVESPESLPGESFQADLDDDEGLEGEGE